MKSHLQGHIKSLLRHNDYLNFTAEPVIAKQRRLTSETNVGGTFDTQTSSQSVKIESTQLVVEKENSDAIINTRMINKKFKIESSVPEGKTFLAEISNDPTCPQAKRYKTDVSFYDPASDIIVRRYNLDSNDDTSPALIRHFKSEFEEEARSSPEEEQVELIPYYSSVARDQYYKAFLHVTSVTRRLGYFLIFYLFQQGEFAQ